MRQRARSAIPPRSSVVRPQSSVLYKEPLICSRFGRRIRAGRSARSAPLAGRRASRRTASCGECRPSPRESPALPSARGRGSRTSTSRFPPRSQASRLGAGDCHVLARCGYAGSSLVGRHDEDSARAAEEHVLPALAQPDRGNGEPARKKARAVAMLLNRGYESGAKAVRRRARREARKG